MCVSEWEAEDERPRLKQGSALWMNLKLVPFSIHQGADHSSVNCRQVSWQDLIIVFCMMVYGHSSSDSLKHKEVQCIIVMGQGSSNGSKMLPAVVLAK